MDILNSKILIYSDSSHQSDNVNVLHADVTMKMKEIMSIQRFLGILEVLIPISCNFCSDTFISSVLMLTSATCPF